MLSKPFLSLFIMPVLCSCSLNIRGEYHLDSFPDQDIIDPLSDDIIITDLQQECRSYQDCDDGNPCNGTEICDINGTCVAAPAPLPDGNVCGIAPRQICIAGNCQASICGDGYVDEGNSEECDDANLIPGDGCENNCTLTNECTDDDQCNDGRSCTTDRCDPDLHICIHVTRAIDVLCRPSSGPCDAEEYCDGISPDCPPDQTSLPGTPCNDDDPCTDPDECNSSGTCAGIDTAELHDVVAIAAGEVHTCGLFRSGAIRCWGYNANGQLGDGTTTNRSIPVDVSGPLVGISAISSGSHHVCALLYSGLVKCWGYNDYGQLGNGSIISSLFPADVSGLFVEVIDISCGGYHTCANTSSSGVKCWGHNDYGQLGDGTTTNSSVPVSVSGALTGVTSISSGAYHTCLLLSSGAVKCWGNNAYGQLGDGTIANSYIPLDVIGLSSGVSALSCGFYHTCALLTAGGIKCWGSNTYGQLGDGTVSDSHIPIDVSGLSSGVSAVSSGTNHTCALLTSGGIKCWGANDYGQLGDGTNLSKITPADVSSLASGASWITTGGYHTCASTAAETAQCWGANNYGQLGNGASITSYFPVYVVCP